MRVCLSSLFNFRFINVNVVRPTRFSCRHTEAEIDELINTQRAEMYAQLDTINVDFEEEQPFESSEDEQVNPNLLEVTKG